MGDYKCGGISKGGELTREGSVTNGATLSIFINLSLLAETQGDLFGYTDNVENLFRGHHSPVLALPYFMNLSDWIRQTLKILGLLLKHSVDVLGR